MLRAPIDEPKMRSRRVGRRFGLVHLGERCGTETGDTGGMIAIIFKNIDMIIHNCAIFRLRR
jgi:hypothetical protein